MMIFITIFINQNILLKNIDENDDVGRRVDEFYSYSQTNESTSYSMLDIMAHNTVLDSYQITNLDSGRLKHTCA